MEKLVIECHNGDEEYGTTHYIPFSYESKDKFIFDILEKYQNYKFREYSFYCEKVKIMEDVWYDKFDIENIEYKVFSIDDWFENFSIKDINL